LLDGGGDLGQMNLAILPGNHVAGPGDANRQLIVLPLNPAQSEDVEQLGVQRPPVELKDQIRDSRSDQMEVHDGTARPLPGNVVPRGAGTAVRPPPALDSSPDYRQGLGRPQWVFREEIVTNCP